LQAISRGERVYRGSKARTRTTDIACKQAPTAALRPKKRVEYMLNLTPNAQAISRGERVYRGSKAQTRTTDIACKQAPTAALRPKKRVENIS
jgi:hypothetical protein